VSAGLFGAGWSALARRGLDSPVAAALLWTALDRLRHWEFPWAVLGYAQHDSKALLPLAAFGGVYALSFVTVLGGAGLAALATGRRRQAGLALAGVAVAHAAGLLAPDPGPPPGADTVRVGVLQGNIDQGVKWSRSYADETLAIYESLTREAVAAGASLVVWPETAVPGALEVSPSMHARVASLARETGAELVVGGVGLELDAAGRPRRFFDSGFVFARDGSVSDRYDKAQLVPFGEYVPFRPLLGLFVSAVASGAATLDVSAGTRPRAVDLGALGSRRAGVVVCYELLFPHLLRRFAADGASVLLAITNDAWYGRTGAPHQFLAITALRSAETGLYTARAANTGVSGFIDGRGRVLERTPVFERAWRVMDVPLHPDPARATFYVRHGDVFAWTCVAGCGVLLAAAARRARARDARMGDAPASPARGPG
jgi:apolipoprotein N-acyltransferase